MRSLAARFPASWQRLEDWPFHAAWLAIAAISILIICFADAADMAGIWWNSSTFGHCLLIPLILVWLVQQRWPQLKEIRPVAWWPGLIWVGAGTLVWLAGYAAGVALARHLAVVMLLQGSVVSLLGPKVSRGLCFPLFYMFFLVPFGEELVPPLQTVTAWLAMLFLGWAGVPAYLSGVFITTPTGYFEVAEACSGAKFLIAMAAYAALVCNLCFKSWPRRLVFLTSALAISVLANGIRAFGTVYVAHRTSSDFAVGFDHVIYGWFFFAIVLVLVMAAGWPLFDRRADDPFFDPERLQGKTRLQAPAATVALLAIMLAAAGPAWQGLAARRAGSVTGPVVLPEVNNWRRVAYRPLYPWRPHFAGADQTLLARYQDAAGREVDLYVAVYADQRDGRELVGFGQGAVDPESKWAWTANLPAPPGGRTERIVAPGPVVREVVSFYSIGGVLTGSAAQAKWQTLRTRLTGGEGRAIAVLVSAEEREGRTAASAISAFLKDMGSPRRITDQPLGKD